MLRPGQVICLCVIALLVIGVVMVNSAGMTVEPVETVPVGPAPVGAQGAGVRQVLGAILLSRSVLYMGLAVVAMCLAALCPIGRLSAWFTQHTAHGPVGPPNGRSSPVRGLVLGSVALLLIISAVYWPGLSHEVNGSRRWIAVPLPGLRALSVQPSELAKWGLIPVLALYGATRARLMPSFRFGLLPGLVAVGIVSAAVIAEDLGTGVLMGAVGCIVLFAAGARFWHFLTFVPLAALGLALAIVTSPYRVQRLITFLDPYADPKGAGYHMIQSMAAVAGGEGFGRGLGHGLQKFGYLPEPQTDFLFAVICEELGIAGAAVVIALLVALLWSGLAVVRRETDPLLKLLGLGILSTVGLQAIINLVVVTGLGPTKGIALPLVSSGGTGWILTAASLGLLVAIDARHDAEHEATAESPLPAGAASLPAP